ncbi:unnamed protein product, partial [Amoebophrya sp. A120]
SSSKRNKDGVLRVDKKKPKTWNRWNRWKDTESFLWENEDDAKDDYDEFFRYLGVNKVYKTSGRTRKYVRLMMKKLRRYSYGNYMDVVDIAATSNCDYAEECNPVSSMQRMQSLYSWNKTDSSWNWVSPPSDEVTAGNDLLGTLALPT